MTGLGNNTYLIATGGRAWLIDAGVGHPDHLEELAGHLVNSRSVLDLVLVTHGHADHAAGAPSLARRHPGVRFLKWPWPPEDQKYEVEWERVRDGESVQLGDHALVALHTPGHSPDHLAFWHEPSRTVFAGDLVIPGGSVMIHASGGGDLRQYLASLSRIRDLEPRRLLPAHGGEASDPVAVLTGHIAHRLRREEQVLEALRNGCLTVEAIAANVYTGLGSHLMPGARENVRAHLEKLRQEARAFVEESTQTWTT